MSRAAALLLTFCVHAALSLTFCLHACVIESGVSAVVTEAERACVNGDRCVKVEVDCCSCNSAGALTAIREDAQAIVAERCAAPKTCSSAISNDPTCTVETRAECIDGRCELVAR